MFIYGRSIPSGTIVKLYTAPGLAPTLLTDFTSKVYGLLYCSDGIVMYVVSLSMVDSFAPPLITPTTYRTMESSPSNGGQLHSSVALLKVWLLMLILMGASGITI